MKSKRYKTPRQLAASLGLPRERGDLAAMKAQMIGEIIKTIQKKKLTHQQVADLSGVPRSAITGIVNGSLKKVTLDRIVRILNALGKTVELKIRPAA